MNASREDAEGQVAAARDAYLVKHVAVCGVESPEALGGRRRAEAGEVDGEVVEGVPACRMEDGVVVFEACNPADTERVEPYLLNQ